MFIYRKKVKKVSSLRGEFFKMMMRRQNINPIIHPEMEKKMKEMSDKYSYIRKKRGYNIECLTTSNGTKYQLLRKEGKKGYNKAIYYIHGGCYRCGLTYNYRDFVAPFCDINEGMDIILLDYKLAPESRFPVQHDEAMDLWDEIKDKYGEDNVIIGGDSSGGNLVLSILLKLRDKGRKLPKGCFLLSPWTDLTALGNSYKTNYKKDVEIGDANGIFDDDTRKKLLDSYLFDYIGDADRYSPYVSPAYAEFKDFPAMLIFVGGDEMLLDDSRIVYNKAKNAGVDIELEIKPGMFHSYVLYQNFMPESRDSYKKLKRFIERVL